MTEVGGITTQIKDDPSVLIMGAKKKPAKEEKGGLSKERLAPGK